MNKLRQNYIDVLVWICEHNVLETLLCDIGNCEGTYNKPENNLVELIKDSEYALS